MPTGPKPACGLRQRLDLLEAADIGGHGEHRGAARRETAATSAAARLSAAADRLARQTLRPSVANRRAAASPMPLARPGDDGDATGG